MACRCNTFHRSAYNGVTYRVWAKASPFTLKRASKDFQIRKEKHTKIRERERPRFSVAASSQRHERDVNVTSVSLTCSFSHTPPLRLSYLPWYLLLLDGVCDLGEEVCPLLGSYKGVGWGEENIHGAAKSDETHLLSCNDNRLEHTANPRAEAATRVLAGISRVVRSMSPTINFHCFQFPLFSAGVLERKSGIELNERVSSTRAFCPQQTNSVVFR